MTDLLAKSLCCLDLPINGSPVTFWEESLFFGTGVLGLAPAVGVCLAIGLIAGLEEEDVFDAWDALKEEAKRSQERFEDQWDPSPPQSHDEWYCPGCREFQDADEPNHIHS